MTCICPHCFYRGSDWKITHGLAWCPKCYRASPIERVQVREPPPEVESDAARRLKELFGWKSGL